VANKNYCCRRHWDRHVVRRYGVKGDFLCKFKHSKNFGTTPAAIFASPIDIEKLIKAEGLILVKLTRGRFRFKSVAAPFRCLSFITEFVGTSFDAASAF
jgi:hypothetical protein